MRVISKIEVKNLNKVFRKVIISAFCFLVSIHVIYADEYDLKERQVLGEDKSKNGENLKEIKDVKINNDKANVEFKEPAKEKEEESAKKIEVSGELKDVAPVTKPQVIMTENEDRLKENSILFGTGGYRKIDSFKYIVDYTKDFKENEFTYYIHLARDLKGEYRKNSDIGIDNYYGKIWYKNSTVGLYHTIENSKLPGIESSPVSVKSTKDDRTTELKIRHTIKSNQDSSLRAGIDIFKRDVESSTVIREYNNNYFDLDVEYDKIIDFEKYKNFFKVKGKYMNDYVDLGSSTDGKTAGFIVEAENKITLKNDPSLIFQIKTGFEAADKKNNSDERNLIAGVKIEKLFNEKFGASVEVEKDGFSMSNREINGNFKLDNDIIPFGDLKSEENFKIEALGYINGKNSYLEAALRKMSSSNKVIFSETSAGLTNEIAVAALNYNRNLDWNEIQLRGSYTYNNLRGEIKDIISTLDEISFYPKNILTTTIVYEKGKYKTSVAGNLLSKMYNLPEYNGAGTKNIRETLDTQFTLDWYNNYKISEGIEGGFAITNLFDSKKEYKSGYNIDRRKISAEIKVRF